MKRRIGTLLIAGVLMLETAPRLSAVETPENAHLWKPKVTSLTVFKNGLGFFLRQGTAALRDGWSVSDAVPPATFGTLAIYAVDPAATVDIVGSGPGEIVAFDGVDAPKDLAAKRTRLEGLTFLKLQLTYDHQGAERVSAGKLVSVGVEYAVLQADNHHFAVPIAGIRRLQVLEKPLRVHVAFEGKQAPAETELGMAYLRKGVTWIPEYTLRLLDDETAELTLRGTLVNEAEDLIDCDVNFVVGVPNFLHTEFMAPLAVGQVIRTIGAAVAPREVMTQLMNRAAIATDQRADIAGVVDRPAHADGRDLRQTLGNLPQLEGAGADDFTVYTRSGLTLRQGEKAIVTLFTRKIRYSHVYRWSPPGDIRHLLVLHNDTDTAWTTGPCLALSESRALSQDLLRYVPRGGRGEFAVTTAINIAQQQQESEVERQLRAHQPATNFWVDMVTLDGELTLRNFGKTPAEIVVELQVQGRPLTASDDGHITLDTAELRLLERKGTVTWNLTLPPEGRKTLTYRYERYVPSR